MISCPTKSFQELHSFNHSNYKKTYQRKVPWDDLTLGSPSISTKNLTVVAPGESGKIATYDDSVWFVPGIRKLTLVRLPMGVRTEPNHRKMRRKNTSIVLPWILSAYPA